MYDKIEELSHASNLSNVAHLKEENERLKDLVLEKSAKIEALYEGTEEYQKLLLEAQRLIAEYQKIIPDSKTDNDETS
jgi:cell shape-determining protein MreC